MNTLIASAKHKGYEIKVFFEDHNEIFNDVSARIIGYTIKNSKDEIVDSCYGYPYVGNGISGFNDIIELIVSDIFITFSDKAELVEFKEAIHAKLLFDLI